MLATIHLVDHKCMIDLYGNGTQADVVKKLLDDGKYTAVKTIDFKHLDESSDVADEVFDLTNNPSRQEERERLYGNGRSLSVGDIVEAGGEKLVCCSIGWAPVE